MVHGMGDHVLRHEPMIRYFTDHHLNVLAYDQRGHGHSEGPRGHSPDYQALMNDVRQLVAEGSLASPDLPITLYGHSMGGNLVLNYAIRDGRDIRSVIASSPWLGLAFKPPLWKTLLARLAFRFVPRITQQTGLDANRLSHDPQVARSYKEDALVHGKITAGFYVMLLDSGKWAVQHAADLNMPALLVHGTADEITSFDSSQAFVNASAGKASMLSFENLFHEIHHEKERELLFRKIYDWIRQFH